MSWGHIRVLFFSTKIRPACLIEILIAGDNQHFRRALATILEEMGYSVSEASNGTEALRDLDSLTRFCLLITDLAMPDMDGIELAMPLRKFSTYRRFRKDKMFLSAIASKISTTPSIRRT